MGNSLEQHRAAIGLFNSRSRTKREAPDWWVETPTWSAFRPASLQMPLAKRSASWKPTAVETFGQMHWNPQPAFHVISYNMQTSKKLSCQPTMTATTSDITNLLHMGASAGMNWVDISVKSMIVTAKMCLIRHPGLQKVFIMEQLPRKLKKHRKAILAFQDCLRCKICISLYQVWQQSAERTPTACQLSDEKGSRGVHF